MAYDPNDNSLTINLHHYESDRNENKYKGAIAHELQHYIQTGLDQGGGTSVEGEKEKIREKIRFLLQRARNTKSIQDSQWYYDLAKDLEGNIDNKAEQNYHQNTGEREAHAVEAYISDHSMSPYRAHNKYAEAHGIET